MADSILTLDVEKPTAGGRMLARHNGQIVLAWGAIPGEQVRARVERSGKGVLYAQTVDVISASPDRRDSAGDWRCGGNVLAHVTYARQLKLKSDIIRDAFARIGRLPLAEAPAVAASPEQGYRMRARLHVRDGRIGFVREQSHEICAVGPTGQMLPATVAWIEEAERRLRRDRLQGLTSIEIAENVPGSERACHLTLEPGAVPESFSVLADDSVTGLSAEVLDRRGIKRLSGEPMVSDVVRVGSDGDAATVKLQRDPRSFFQGNRFLLEEMTRTVSARVPAGPIGDLYAGVGLFGLSLAAAGATDVTLVEGDSISGQDLVRNAEPFGGRVRVERTSVEAFVRGARSSADATFIVDPPRTGMSKEALHALAQKGPKRIVYVSCDVATLARDARLLLDRGYSLDDITALDLFPNTAHIETIATFRVGQPL